MKKLNERGAALLVVMIAGVLGILIAFAMAKLTSATSLLSKSAALEGEINKLVREINGLLADAKSCPGAFRDASDVAVSLNIAAVLPTPVATVNRLYWGFNGGGARPIAKLSASATDAGLVITKMQLENPVQITTNTWELTLDVQLEKKIDSTTYFPGASVIAKKFRIAATLNGTAIAACSPLGGRLALGPMSPIRSTIATTPAIHLCDNDVDKDNACLALQPAPLPNLPAYPRTYFAANQGDALFYGMIHGTVPIPLVGTIPGFGLYGIAGRLIGKGGGTSWAEYDLATVDDVCTVLCINKDAPMRFTRNGVLSSASTTVKDNACKTEFRESPLRANYIAATFNDFAQAGWSSSIGVPPTGSAVYAGTIAGQGNAVEFGVDVNGNRVINVTGSAATVPLACVHLR